MLLTYNNADTRCYGSYTAFIKILYNYSAIYMATILPNVHLLPLPVRQVIVLKKPELNAHSPCSVATGSAKQYLSEKIKPLYKTVVPLHSSVQDASNKRSFLNEPPVANMIDVLFRYFQLSAANFCTVHARTGTRTLDRTWKCRHSYTTP